MCPLFYVIFEVLDNSVEFFPAPLACRGGPDKGVTMSGALPSRTENQIYKNEITRYNKRKAVLPEVRYKQSAHSFAHSFCVAQQN
jgi:hypothetical protein